MTARLPIGFKICPICAHENADSDFLCGVCTNDLTFTPIITRAPDLEPPPAATPGPRLCENGHALMADDSLCLECGAPPAQNDGPEGADRDDFFDLLTCGELVVKVPEGVEVGDFCWIDHESQRVRLFPRGWIPDPTLSERLARIASPSITSFIGSGTTAEDPQRFYEIWERSFLPVLESTLFKNDHGGLPTFAAQLSRAVQAIHRQGLLIRDLHRESLRWGTAEGDETPRLVICDLSQAAIADLGVSRQATRRTPAYLAPEAAVGIYEEASDWWSVGALLLDLLAGHSTERETLNEQAVLLGVVTRGIAVPESLPPDWTHLIKGLLTRDPAKRWTGDEVSRWLDGERGIPHFYEGKNQAQNNGKPLPLGEFACFSAEQWALNASNRANWDEAQNQLSSGTLATWLDERTEETPIRRAEVDRLRRDEGITPDERLAAVIVFLNPRLPLNFRGALVNPRWLLENVETALAWFEGEFPERLRRIERVDWLVDLHRRRQRAAALAESRGIVINRDAFRAASLLADSRQLSERWIRRRRAFPLAQTRSLASLAEKDSPQPEELAVLVAAEISQFTSAEEILTTATREAQNAQVEHFDPEIARPWFDLSQRELFRTLNARLNGFVRCGNERLDEWADEFRFERRLPLARALILLQVPEPQWQSPPAHDYLTNLFDFFHRKILRGIQQGPLLRLRVSRNSRNLDLTELGGPQLTSETLLARIFSREEALSAIDPKVFFDNPPVEQRLRRLERMGLNYQRDTGIDSVYLGFPFLIFRPLSASPTAQPKRAPLFLWPVELKASGGLNGRFRLRYDHQRAGDEFESGGILLNPALQTLLPQDEIEALQQALSEGLAGSELTASHFYQLCTTALPQAVHHPDALCPLPSDSPPMDHGGEHLYPAGALFLCDFSQQTIATDIRQLKGRQLHPGALAQMLRVPGTALPRCDPHPPPEALPELEKFFVLPADPSQQKAVLEARQPSGVVIQGPPGTGKSQTIVNIIADCLGRGERALVVCQKHAALDVVAKRLAEEGLNDRFFQVEDAGRSRQPIIRALRSQTEASSFWRRPDHPSTRADLATHIERLENELCAHAAATHAIVHPSGLTYAGILDELIRLREKPSLPAFALRQILSPLSWEAVSSLTETIAPLAPLWYHSRYFESPWHSLVDFPPDPATLTAFQNAFHQYELAELERHPLARQADTIFLHLDPEATQRWIAQNREILNRLPNQVVADAHRWKDLFGEREPTESTALTHALQTLAETARALPTPPRHHELSKPVAALAGKAFRRLAQASHRHRATASHFLKRLLPTSFLDRRALRSFLNQHCETGPTDGLDELSDLHQQLDWEAERRRLDHQCRSLAQALGETPSETPETRSDPAQIRRRAETLIARLNAAREAFRISLDCPVSDALNSAFASGSSQSLKDFLAASELSLRYATARTQSLDALNRLKPWFSEDFVTAQTHQIDHALVTPEDLDTLRDHLPALAHFLHFRPRFKNLPANEKTLWQTLESTREVLDSDPPSALPQILQNTIRHEALRAWREIAETQSPALLATQDELDTKVRSLADADARFRTTTVQDLRKPWRPETIANATTWLEILMLRGARALRLREIFDQGIERGLLNLRPIWLASPETVSRLFPLRENLFDVVIFDEASQIPVEMALPSLYRAARVVVSGDEKQLPPTSFFRSNFDDSAEEDPDESLLDDGSFLDPELDSETRQRLSEKMTKREVKDCDDLLQLASGDLPNNLLTIHYRSRWRHLIGFSNHAFYDGKLSVPVHHPDGRIRAHQPIEMRHVNSPYEKQTNEGEAQAVLEFLAEHWRQPQPASVGVVTFNLKQAELIQDLIEERMADDPEFRAHCERDLQRPANESFFVKNLENVQGDERDLIVFSTTFGPNAAGRFLRNFGPASQRGGQRRLNVAVTRSRNKMVIFTSLPITEIAPNLPGEGTTPRDLLKAYLAYASALSTGDFPTTNAIQRRLLGPREHQHDRSLFETFPTRPFIEEIESFLRQNGFDPERDPSSDAFGVDLALIDPTTQTYGLAIECDPPQHPDLTTARAREIWRPETMQGSIPKIIRLSARQWFDHPEAEKKRLLKLIAPLKPTRKKSP